MTTAVPRGWNRPVRPVALLTVGAAVLLAWLVIMGVSVWYFYAHWEARLTLHNQDVTLRLPAGMPAMAEINSPLKTRIALSPLIHVPLKQMLVAQLSDQIQAKVKLKTVLPIDTTVNVDQVVSVTTTLSMLVPLRSWLPKINVTLPLTVNVPVHLVVPIKLDLPVDLDLLVGGDLPPTLNVPVDATFDVRPEVKGLIEARIQTLTEFKLISPVEPIPVRIEQAHLRVPFNLAFLKQRVACRSTGPASTAASHKAGQLGC